MKKIFISASVLFLTTAAAFAQSMTTTTTSSTTTVTNGMPANVNMGMSVNGQPVMVETAMPQMNMTMNGMQGASTTTTTTSTTVTESGMPPAMAPTPAPCTIGQAQFEDIKRSIAAQTFEDTKVSEATQVMNTHCLASWQVRDIMKLFGYENNRLTFAQRAYPKTLDPANYYMVNDAFESLQA